MKLKSLIIQGKISPTSSPCPRSKLVRFILPILIGSSCFNAGADGLSISAQYGIDSNPHSLADSFSPNQDNFILGDFGFKSNYERLFYFDANFRSATYSKDSNADWSKGNLDLAVKSNFVIEEMKFKYRLSVDFTTQDDTYISKFTGLEASFNGQSLGDRYDSDIVNFNSELSYKTQNNLNLGFSYQRRNKKYQSYNVVGLSKLDYSHDNFGFDLDYPFSKNSSISINSNYTLREYENRRVKNLSGLDINDTDLAFNLYDIKTSYIYSASKVSLWKYSIKLGKRIDNGLGYWDSNSNYASVYTKQQVTAFQSLRMTLKYSVFSYDNRLEQVGADIDEQAKENKGFSLDIDYRWMLLPGKSSELSTYLKLELDSFDSSTLEYKFKRNQISVGILWELG